MFTVLIPNLGSTIPVTTETYREARALAKSQSGQIVWPSGVPDIEQYLDVEEAGFFKGSYDDWAEAGDSVREKAIEDLMEWEALGLNEDEYYDSDNSTDVLDEDDCCDGTDLETP